MNSAFDAYPPSMLDLDSQNFDADLNAASFRDASALFDIDSISIPANSSPDQLFDDAAFNAAFFSSPAPSTTESCQNTLSPAAGGGSTVIAELGVSAGARRVESHDPSHDIAAKPIGDRSGNPLAPIHISSIPMDSNQDLSDLQRRSSPSPVSSSLASSSDSTRKRHRISSSPSSQSATAEINVGNAGSGNEEHNDDEDGETSLYMRRNMGNATKHVAYSNPTTPSIMSGGHSSRTVESGSRFLGPTAQNNPDALDFSNRAMENHFDFDSAASSPSPFSNNELANGVSYTMPLRGKTDSRGISLSKTPVSSTTLPRYQSHSSQNLTLDLVAPSMADRTPTAADLGFPIALRPAQSHSLSPSPVSAEALGDNGSPAGVMHRAAYPFPYQQGSTLTSSLQASAMRSLPNGQYTPTYNRRPISMPSQPLTKGNQLSHQLFIHPTSNKSRVETQIAITMSLYPMPPGVTKVRLPPETVSRQKLAAKSPLVKTPDTLELSVTLHCTSAMKDERKRWRAMLQARTGQATVDADEPELPAGSDPGGGAKKSEGRRFSSGDAEGAGKSKSKAKSDGLNGGAVEICAGCVTRERKRVWRKKTKKPEEEAWWAKDEDKRIILFNTTEVKEWHQPPSKAEIATRQRENGKNGNALPPEAFTFRAPEGALQVELPMRITCYCRHHNEKEGFIVIFTLKDFQGNPVAQTMSNSIMITDDHKTHVPPAPIQHSMDVGAESPNGQADSGLGQDVQGSPEEAGSYTNNNNNNNNNFMGPESNGKFGTEASKLSLVGHRKNESYGHIGSQESFSGYGNGLYRNAHSATDLASLESRYFGHNLPYAQQKSTTPFTPTQNVSRATSATTTPRNLSRPASPSAPDNPVQKKRKAGGGPQRLPDSLRMTQLHSSTGPSAGQRTNGSWNRAGASVPVSPASAVAPSTAPPFSTEFPRSSGPRLGTEFPRINTDFRHRPVRHSHQRSQGYTNPTTPVSNDQKQFTIGNRSQSMDNLASLQQALPDPNAARGIRPTRPSPGNQDAGIGPHSQFSNGLSNANQLLGDLSAGQLENLVAAGGPHPDAVAAALSSAGLLNARRLPPRLYKVLPSEGSKSGGIEVVCLGSDFYDGLEIMFGDQLAQTAFWSENCLVCILPSSVKSGPVPVMLRHEYEQLQALVSRGQMIAPVDPRSQVAFTIR